MADKTNAWEIRKVLEAALLPDVGAGCMVSLLNVVDNIIDIWLLKEASEGKEGAPPLGDQMPVLMSRYEGYLNTSWRQLQTCIADREWGFGETLKGRPTYGAGETL